MATATSRGASRGRSLLFWVVLTLFVIVPLVEIYVIIQVGQAIGAWWTIVLLVADSVLGSWLVKREGVRAWRALRQALASGRMPATELADGGLILIGGTLMVAPGFVTDIVALLLILPLTRPLFRGLLAGLVGRRLLATATGAGTGTGTGTGTGPAYRPGSARRPGTDRSGPVVRGEVVDE